MKKFMVGLVLLSVLFCGVGCSKVSLSPTKEKAMAWGLGDDYVSLPIELTGDRWNERHGDIFKLKGSDNYLEALSRIIEAYSKKVEE